MRKSLNVASNLACAALALCLLIGHQSAFSANKKSATKSPPSAKPAAPALADVQSKYKGVKSLTAEFTQKQTNIALGTVKETSGRIYIKRPNLFRWETHKPEKEASILVGNGKKVWFYKPPYREGEHGQVLIRDAADVQSQLALDLLAGRIDVKKQFKYKDLGEGRFELTPLQPAGDVDHIELFIERPTKLVYKLLLFTATGNTTELELKNVTLDPKLGDAMFNFKTPPNTEEVY